MELLKKPLFRTEKTFISFFNVQRGCCSCLAVTTTPWASLATRAHTVSCNLKGKKDETNTTNGPSTEADYWITDRGAHDP